MQTRELVIAKTSAIPVVPFKVAKVQSLDDSMARWVSVKLRQPVTHFLDAAGFLWG